MAQKVREAIELNAGSVKEIGHIMKDCYQYKAEQDRAPQVSSEIPLPSSENWGTAS